MLLAAQHVRHRTGAEGINVSGYVHGPDLSKILHDRPDLALDGSIRGKLAFTLHEVERRGALVVSFLDVAFPDGAVAPDVATFIERITLTAETKHGPVSMQERGIAARFVVQPIADAALELRSLKTALLPVVGHLSTASTPMRPPQPVRVFRERGPHGYRFTLSPGDRQALGRILGRTLPGSLGIADETFDDFVAFASLDFYAMVMTALCSVGVEQLDAFGGAEIRDNQSGTVVWASPRHTP